jgi:alkylated DNA repair dioxygenase AlkB
VPAPTFPLPGLTLWAPFLPPADADAALVALREEVAWTQGEVRVFGRTHPEPRLTAWVADPGLAYSYSGRRREPQSLGRGAPCSRRRGTQSRVRFRPASADAAG